mmetsp:Transcript_991/g.2184  ORF Transcript_991/g.2184 Transcript_991/m.2184 type:complete len:289 (+) Transcript_991:306-1172(+)
MTMTRISNTNRAASYSLVNSVALSAVVALFALCCCSGADAAPDAAAAAGNSSQPVLGIKVPPASLPFADAFLASLMMIIVSELGDKTFFIAAILAMKNPRMVVFIGALAALATMTVLSAGFGWLLPTFLPRLYTHYASVVLFLIFGVRLLKDGYEMEAGHVSEELEEVENELSKAAKKTDVESAEEGQASQQSEQDGPKFKQGVLWQSFILTFVAEWGDRSQIATIALAAQKDPYGVTIGGVIGHALCTGLAVMGGRMLATRISEKTVNLCGGALFLLFAVHGIVMGP